MRFVNDVDLGPGVGARRIHRPLAQIARVIDAAVRRGVELDNIQIGRAGPDPPAGVALTARLAGCRATLAVQRHGEDAGRGGLADAPGTGEEIAVGDPPLRDGAAERGSDVLLGDEIGELLGAILAR